jgi:HD-GYP domain-containing protein (c-di-GMP phosphodiesterase class II)
MVIDSPSTFYSLMKINNYDYYTFTHSVNVSTLSLALAMAAGIKEKKELSHLGLGAILHDLGKSSIDKLDTSGTEYPRSVNCN